ncbi:hypothetical protein A8B82_07370 [Sulfitobacter sp. EhC04]|uniref:hypothetical protein n=1 Tax=Sulfitobacter sp. EhC04 TaxID=1849168 RepID=UPI0007F52938|nr:hypothetical protein [Sulfitobacter sp. EhC04]OAN79844.1 hypothetical protein A8B82_07370 [Sulfitobacter sp. EhC04]
MPDAPRITTASWVMIALLALIWVLVVTQTDTLGHPIPSWLDSLTDPFRNAASGHTLGVGYAGTLLPLDHWEPKPGTSRRRRAIACPPVGRAIW